MVGLLMGEARHRVDLGDSERLYESNLIIELPRNTAMVQEGLLNLGVPRSVGELNF
jgi:hypothetical protein